MSEVTVDQAQELLMALREHLNEQVGAHVSKFEEESGLLVSEILTDRIYYVKETLDGKSTKAAGGFEIDIKVDWL